MQKTTQSGNIVKKKREAKNKEEKDRIGKWDSEKNG